MGEVAYGYRGLIVVKIQEATSKTPLCTGTGSLRWEGVSVASPVLQRHPWEAPVSIEFRRNALWDLVRAFKELQSYVLFNLRSGKETWFPHRHCKATHELH